MNYYYHFIFYIFLFINQLSVFDNLFHFIFHLFITYIQFTFKYIKF